MKQLDLVFGLFLLTFVFCGAANAAPPATSAEFVVSQHDNLQYDPQIAYNWKRGEFLVVWYNNWNGYRDVYARRVDHFGTVLGEYVIDAGVNDNLLPAVAYNPVDDEYLVVWGHDCAGDGSDWDIYGRRIPWNGPSQLLPAFEINAWASNQWTPKVAWSDTDQEYMVVWTTIPVSGLPTIDAQRLSPGGTSIGSAFNVASGSEPRANPDIAYNHARNEYLVSYELYRSSTDIAATRLNVIGAPIGAEIIVAGWPEDEEHPSVAASALEDGYIVAWQSWNPVRKVYARVVGGDSSFGAGPVLIADGVLHNTEPDVSCNANLGRCLVAWMGQYSNLNGVYGVFARTLDFAGGVGEVALVRPIPVNDDSDTAAPSIAAFRGGWLVAWEHHRPGTGFWDVHGRMVWQLFVDGFEAGNLGQWSGVVQ